MKKLIVVFIISSLSFLFCQCNEAKKEESEPMTQQKPVKSGAIENRVISEAVAAKVIDGLVAQYGDSIKERAQRGVNQIARIWRTTDGNPSQFEDFCKEHFINSNEMRESVFEKMSRNYEILYGNFNKIILDLQEPLQLDMGKILPIDELFGGYNPATHLDEDFYANKIAFIAALNYPFYSLKEKKELGSNWSRLEWAYARMGDLYIARVPAELKQKYSEINTRSDTYISQYNIYMGSLVNDAGEKLFPKDLVLLTHWNLRDELRSNYRDSNGEEKQDMIYEVMNRIISQDIPRSVIDNGDLDWNPFKNKVYKNGKEIEFKPEPDTRYRYLLDNFKILSAMDPYYPPALDTYIKRNFDMSMEISFQEVEALFIEFLSSPQVKQVARLIANRLGRDLKPYDVWYDGFKSGNLSEDKLNRITRKKYPNTEAMEKDFPNILMKLGFSKDKAEFLSSMIVVDKARGSGHAWGAQMKEDKAHLRTRISQNGMDYKGYNIAVHEFGHNVEQTISLQDVDYYMLSGVPNTAFTEALAFMFQVRDLELLGFKEVNSIKEHLITLDTFWNVYESMGVSLVDMYIWKWMYENPDASPAQLKDAVIRIAKDVWNKYFAELLGAKDQSILAIYSHIISYPLYLSAYSYGYLIDFQLEQYIKGKNFGAEVERMFSLGRLIPQEWMKKAVGNDISIAPILQATDEALSVVIK